MLLVLFGGIAILGRRLSATPLCCIKYRSCMDNIYLLFKTKKVIE